MDIPETTVGLGDIRYKVHHSWGQFPEGISIGRISKVAVDSDENIYVAQRTAPQVIVLDQNGNYLRSWGQDILVDPHGIYATSDDNILVVDRGGHQVVCFDNVGNVVFTLGERDRPRFQAPFNHPTDIAVAPNGDMYVSDGYGNAAVHRFSADGELISTWGAPGDGPGEFTTPHGIWVVSDGRVLVGDRENNRIQVFDPEGEYLTEWGGVYKPMDIFADADDMVYVADQIPRLTKFTPAGEIIGRTMCSAQQGHGIRGDGDGNIYIAETVYDYLVKLERLRDA